MAAHPEFDEIAIKPNSADEFFGNIWWIPNENGRLRSATLGECADEIRRLRRMVEILRNFPSPQKAR